jgi:hypothetical protein
VDDNRATMRTVEEENPTEANPLMQTCDGNEEEME